MAGKQEAQEEGIEQKGRKEGTKGMRQGGMKGERDEKLNCFQGGTGLKCIARLLQLHYFFFKCNHIFLFNCQDIFKWKNSLVCCILVLGMFVHSMRVISIWSVDLLPIAFHVHIVIFTILCISCINRCTNPPAPELSGCRHKSIIIHRSLLLGIKYIISGVFMPIAINIQAYTHIKAYLHRVTHSLS